MIFSHPIFVLHREKNCIVLYNNVLYCIVFFVYYSNGGGAFFIPYFIMLVFVGMPVFFVELSLGQFTSRGPVEAFKFSPLFQGL